MEKRNNYKPYKKNNQNNNRPNREEKPVRRRRVNVDRNVEVAVVNNTLGRFIYENPRMTTAFDMEQYGDEDYITVGELRTMINSNRKIFESFQLLITEVLDSEYTLEDVLVYLGLDRKYNEYFSMSPDWKRGQVNVGDFQMFIEKSNPRKFKQLLDSMDSKLRNKVIEISVALFKTGKFGDYQKMRIIKSYVGDDLFDDAEETEIDVNI